MIRRLLRKLTADSPASVIPINLIREESSTVQVRPASIGIDHAPAVGGWTVGRLEQIVQRHNSQPADAEGQLGARHARHCLSSFWLAAPIDQLESLYGGPIGRVYRELLLGSLPSLPLAADESSWKEELARRLQQQFEAPERPNLLLAVMPYCAPGRMRLEDPSTSLPAWLLSDYARCFDPGLSPATGQPVGLLSSSQQTPDLVSVPPLVTATPPAPPAPLPRLSNLEGSEAFAPFQDTAFCERMFGLINLFRLDPTDAEVVEELRRLRRLMGQVWLDVTPASLEPVYQSPFGKVYRALLASDFGVLPLIAEEVSVRQDLTRVAVDDDHPAMARALLAAMLFIPQGKMRLGPGQERLPRWLRDEFGALAGLRTV